MSCSIALATYNGEKYIAEQLASFATQTVQPDELIVVDDVSTDRTLEIVREFAVGAPFKVRISINANNLGYAQNFNKALSLCECDFVFPSDQDDVWHDKKLEEMLRAVNSDPSVYLLMVDTEITDDKLVPSGLTKLDQLHAAGLSEKDFVMGCCMLLRRSLLKLLLPIPTLCRSHDNWIAEFADLLGLKKTVPLALQYYRQHDSNSSEFFVNSNQQVSKSRIFIHSWYSIVKSLFLGDSLQSREVFSSCARDRLRERYTEFSALVGVAKVDTLIELLSDEVDHLSQRLELRRKPRINRVFACYKLWRQGVYKESSGLKSALKDSLVKRLV